jgi:signal transduction histidine kinase/DNA-binding response OmpR family regulator/ligand-binding sensor domain-containing protein
MKNTNRIHRFFSIHFFLCDFLLILLLIGPAIINAQIKQSHFNYFKQYTQEDGLASTYVSDILEDKYGFLWIANGNGVSMFDGNHFTNYTHYQDDSLQVELGFVESIVIDMSGENLLIAGKKGIFYSSIDTVNFVKINKFNPSITIPVGTVNDLVLDNQHQLWSANFDRGLSHFDLNGNEHNIISFNSDSLNRDSKLNSSQCIAIDPYDKNILWIGTLAGLIRFNSVSEEYQVFVYDNDSEMVQNKIRKIHVTNEEVFLGTWAEGLIVFNKKLKQFRQPLKNRYPNSHTLILDIYKENDTNLWITTSDGLIQYNVHSKSIKEIFEHNTNYGSFRGVSYFDSRGIIWFCSSKGLFKYDPLQSKNDFIELESRNSIQNGMLVKQIIKSKNFIYVAGQYSSGLYKINLDDYSFEVIRIPSFDYYKESGYLIMDMVEMDDGNFLLISGKKISIFYPKTQQTKLAPLQINHPNPSLQTVVKDKNNNYWIGAREGGLFCLNFENNSIKNYKKEFNIYHDGNHRWINSLFIDTKNKLWIGKGSASIIMDLNDSFKIYINPIDNKSYTDVEGFHEDNMGRVWMAGSENGLGFTNFISMKNGMSHKVDGYFTGIYPYNDSLLWTTGTSLGTINLNTMSFNEVKLSSKNKKLRIHGPIISTRRNEFIIGCDNGVLIYNPENQYLNKEVPIPYIRKIESNGKVLYEGNNLSINEFNFKSGIRHLVFKLSSLGFHFPDQVTYQYKFEGEWQKMDAGKEINLTNLSYGNYKLKIKACNNLGLCNEAPQIYNISILTPWWATWWAYIIYFGLVTMLVVSFYRFQLAKRLAIAESERLKEVNQLKNSLYANITHEFRTPLTIIIGMVDSLKSNMIEIQDKGAEHALDMIKRNGKNLLKLVNEMLDLSKLESGKMRLRLIQSDVIPFVKYLGESFHSMAHENQISLMVYSEIDELFMDFDANKLSIIISNLLSNAIKFTQPGGKIIIHLNHNLIHKNEFFVIKIKDNGTGIPENEINNIFNRFYQVDNSSSRQGEGTGIGLALAKELVELMNGTIKVKSSAGKGSEFTIQLPINNNAIQTDSVDLQSLPDLNTYTNGEELIQKIVHDQSELPLALIIEDNADVTHYLKTCLKGRYQTINAKNGKSGIEMAFEKVPDIIICDVMMPVKDGFKVCTELKSDERTDHIPVILLTAKVTMKDKLTGLSCGADAYLTKPFVKAELLTRLTQLILLRKKMMQKINHDSFSRFLKTRAENPETKFLQKIIKIIHEEISNHSFGSSIHISRKMHLSESQIYRKLKAITGKSTAVFIRSVRLQKAKEMIQTTDKTISEIAFHVGFNDPSWFSRAFKEEFGYAPSAISK